MFRIISWELSQGIQNVPESTFQYANENALLIAKVLRNHHAYRWFLLELKQENVCYYGIWNFFNHECKITTLELPLMGHREHLDCNVAGQVGWVKCIIMCRLGINVTQNFQSI